MRFLVIFMCVGAIFANEILIEKAMEAGLAPLELKQTPPPRSQVELGKKLFFDTRISNTNTISCNSCHNLALGGSNAIPTTLPFGTNVPTIFNAESSAEFAKKHLQAHITGTLTQTSTALPAKIGAFSQYIVEFKKAYGNNVKIDFELILSALGAFQATLKTQSRYDDFLRGNIKAMNNAEVEGFEIFIKKGCAKCHSGANLGGAAMKFEEISAYKFSKDFKKGEVIKVPILRNITQSAPYLKSGKITSLKDAIALMTKQNETLNETEITKLEAFFKTVEGKKPNITYPELPTEQILR